VGTGGADTPWGGGAAMRSRCNYTSHWPVVTSSDYSASAKEAEMVGGGRWRREWRARRALRRTRGELLTFYKVQLLVYSYHFFPL